MDMPQEKPGSYFYRIAKKLRPVLPYGVLANLVQWISGEIHEADFEVFKSLSEVDGLVLDVGASLDGTWEVIDIDGFIVESAIAEFFDVE